MPLRDPRANSEVLQPSHLVRSQSVAAHAEKMDIGNLASDSRECLKEDIGILVLIPVTYEKHVRLREKIRSFSNRMKARIDT